MSANYRASLWMTGYQDNNCARSAGAERLVGVPLYWGAGVATLTCAAVPGNIVARGDTVELGDPAGEVNSRGTTAGIPAPKFPDNGPGQYEAEENQKEQTRCG